MPVALSNKITALTQEAPKYLRDPSKYDIIDLSTVKYVPRDAFITGLQGPLEASDVDLALALIARQTQAGPSFNEEFLRLATTYDTLRRSQARLPKFSKWVTGLYPKRQELAAEFARLGQKVTSNVFEVSGDVVDILRCADTPHFASCFKKGSMSQDVPKRVAEEAPGMCIIFADDDKGKMKARTWGVHVQDKNGKDALLLGAGRYGAFDVDDIAKKITAKFNIDVYKMPGYEWPPVKHVSTRVTTINAFKERIYFDFQIWGSFDAVLISSATTK
jgi:hypothetical protein